MNVGLFYNLKSICQLDFYRVFWARAITLFFKYNSITIISILILVTSFTFESVQRLSV